MYGKMTLQWITSTGMQMNPMMQMAPSPAVVCMSLMASGMTLTVLEDRNGRSIMATSARLMPVRVICVMSNTIFYGPHFFLFKKLFRLVFSNIRPGVFRNLNVICGLVSIYSLDTDKSC